MQKVTKNYRVGKWLSSDQKFLESWLEKLIHHVDNNPKKLLPPVQDLKDLIEGDNYYKNLFTNMFSEVPKKAPYKNDPTNKPQIRDYDHMLSLMNEIMTQPPYFNKTGLVGFPINAILDWPMGTVSGYVAFLDKKVNEKLKAILQYWSAFLSSQESAKVLNTSESGWLNDYALEQMCDAAYGSNFLDLFETKSDKKEESYGFTSWDNFFTRQFKEGVRPVAGEDNDNIIANACESAPYRLVTNVAEKEEFWIKGQPYSLTDMLAGDDLTSQFVGGTVYQAFLNALSYHRWHSPVSGTIKKIVFVDGSYYSESYYEGFSNQQGPDDSAPNNSQAFLTEVATRAIVFIEADNPAIGLMAFMSIGMAEVSSNDVTVKEGQHVSKGEQLGMFHFGGSTHCLFFRPEVDLAFDLHGQNASLESHNIPLRSKIAEIYTKTPETKEVTVQASQKFQKTGVKVTSKSLAKIEYVKGLWTADPTQEAGLYGAAGNPNSAIDLAPKGYTLEGEKVGALIGKVGEKTFFIGNYATIPQGVEGELELCINDASNDFDNNLGDVTVKVSVG
ncbi:phosphatidylserine decarboxylase [Flammeovirga pectinis]|uniref:Phosphatidylserine decarboxylase n=1 Tax=Flammeovirga pectinis TaxID=2494373 RepID=A0A3Q9FR83_9BACT|nr:phophatidylserine decarboxylase associated domain-containing protein [Flammeovirga pectinis]AZQ65226.1 phosphatidylserine decarboxylase [Flammeovirga pectinis]